MKGESYLLVRRGGSVWGLAGAVVEGRSGAGYRIRSRGADLVADEILDVVERLTIRPPGAALRRFGPEGIAGLAVHGLLPVLVVDPMRPPAALRLLPEEAERDEEGKRRKGNRPMGSKA